PHEGNQTDVCLMLRLDLIEWKRPKLPAERRKSVAQPGIARILLQDKRLRQRLFQTFLRWYVVLGQISIANLAQQTSVDRSAQCCLSLPSPRPSHILEAQRLTKRSARTTDKESLIFSPASSSGHD